ASLCIPLSMSLYFFLLVLRRPPVATLFPYTTLFRSTVTVRVGALNTDTTFSGIFQESGGSQFLAVTKTGTGMLTLSGTSSYRGRSEEHTSELQSRENLVCRLLLEKKKKNKKKYRRTR